MKTMEIHGSDTVWHVSAPILDPQLLLNSFFIPALLFAGLFGLLMMSFGNKN